jgi:hypothetical protein
MMDLHILQYHAINTENTPEDINNALKNISTGNARIIMVAASGKPQSQIMIQAHEMGLINREFVWLMMGDTTKDLQAGIDRYNTNQTADMKQMNYATDYQGLFLFDIWLMLDGYGPFETFLDQWSVLNPQA